MGSGSVKVVQTRLDEYCELEAWCGGRTRDVLDRVSENNCNFRENLGSSMIKTLLIFGTVQAPLAAFDD